MKKLLGVLVLGLLWCSTSYSNIIMQDLIDALVETKKPKSIEVANNLKSTGDNDKSYDFVIRKANLNIKDAKNIANAIKNIDQNKGPQLGTISMSFISMVSMEISMNATDYFLTGGAMLTWWVVPIMLIVGFLTPWPYNYFRLKKFNQACH